MDDLDTLRFELLSAYLDGEVTASERKQVEHWLDTEPAMQRTYQQLLKLHHGFQQMPVPATQPTTATVEQVLARVGQPQRSRLIRLWGGLGTAIAATVVGFISGIVPGTNLLTPQVARDYPELPADTPIGSVNEPATLMIALERPPVEIPQAVQNNLRSNPSQN